MRVLVRCLLDSHALLRWRFDDPRFADTARGIVMDPSDDVFVSSACAWEISTEHRLGKLDSAAPLLRATSGWIARRIHRAPDHDRARATRGEVARPHRDPFERVLAAQSVLEGLPIVRRDPVRAQFGVVPVW